MKSKILAFAWSIDDILFYSSTFNDSNIHFICARLSTYIYAKTNGLNATAFYSEFSLLKKIYLLLNKSVPDCSQYDEKLYDSDISAYAIQLYILKNTAARIFKNEIFDLVLMPGEFRLREQVVLHHLPPSIEVIFWEAGPIGCVYFSPLGTNANSNLAKVYMSKPVQGLLDKHNVQSREEYTVPLRTFIPIFKMIELLYISFSRYILASDEYAEFLPRRPYFRYRPASNHINDDPHSENSRYIIFYGQVEKDVNFTHFSPNLTEIGEIFNRWKRDYPEYTFVLKPHPREVKNSVNTLFLDTFRGQVLLYNPSDEHLMSNNKNVHHVTINSNIIAELLMKGTNVVALGETLYAGLPGVKIDIGELDTEPMDIKKSINAFVNDHFLPINYRQKVWQKHNHMEKFLKEISNG